MSEKKIPLFKIFGIQINLDVSWFIVFFLITFTFATGFFPYQYPGYNPLLYWLVSAIAAILLFVSVLLHELGHSLVARKFGIPVKEIDLFIFGGVAMIEEEAHSPKEEFLIAIAGPVVSISLGFLFLVLAILYPRDDLINGLINYLMYANFLIGLFNLIPAFPLDGGRILRAFLWQKTGDLLKATKAASDAGKLFGIFLVIVGIFYLIAGYFINGVWLILIGFFVFNAAIKNYEASKFRLHLARYKVENFMELTKPLFHDTPVGEVLSGIHHAKGENFIVIGKDGRFHVVDVKKLKDATFLDPIGKYAEKIKCYVSPYDNLYKAYKQMLKCNTDELPVIYKNTLLGIIRKNSFKHLLEAAN